MLTVYNLNISTLKLFLGVSLYKYIYISERLLFNYKGTQNIDK